MNSFAELTVNNKWDVIKTTAAATTTWCFTPSQPVQLYQGDGRGREVVHAECWAEWQGGFGSWGQWLAPDVCGQGVLCPVNQYSYTRAMDEAGRLSTLNAELNDQVGLDLGENTRCLWTRQRNCPCWMLSWMTGWVWIWWGGWWVPDVCGQDREVVHADHWAEWNGFELGGGRMVGARCLWTRQGSCPCWSLSWMKWVWIGGGGGGGGGGVEDGGCQMSVDKTRELSMVITELNELGLDLGRMASTSNQWTRQRSLCWMPSWMTR